MKTCKEKALEWDVTPRAVNVMCKNGRIEGAIKEKGSWLIPDDAEKPIDGRISTGKYVKKIINIFNLLLIKLKVKGVLYVIINRYYKDLMI